MTRVHTHTRSATLAMMVLLCGCSDGPTAPTATTEVSTPAAPSAPTAPTTPTPTPVRASTSPVYVVVFTHIEDNTPAGTLGSSESRLSYLNWRDDLIAMANLARRVGVTWTLQPDWKFLEAALLYETSSVMANTGGVNVFRYLRDSLGVVIDPHSHENGGYNYTDVAYLLDRLGVGGSTVIGGHIWDPSLPQFAEWDRFRTTQSGQKYPQASWRGDILMGAGTPNHVNDPVVAGVWRPRDRWNYFTDDPSANVVALGGFLQSVSGVSTLYDAARSGAVESGCMLTSTLSVRPADIQTAGGLATVEASTLAPLVSLRAQGVAVLTDFTSLVNTWRSQFGAKGCVYRP